jgi:hypothetical protein
MELKDEDVIWVCGTSMPPEGFPGRETAKWGRCKGCGDEITYNSDNDEELAGAIKLCMACAFKMMGEEKDVLNPEITMTKRDEALFDEAFGGGTGGALRKAVANIVEEIIKK